VDELLVNSKEHVAGLARGPNDAKVNFEEYLNRQTASCTLQVGPNLIDSRYESKISEVEPASFGLNSSMNIGIVETDPRMFKSLGVEGAILPKSGNDSRRKPVRSSGSKQGRRS
jgi:hypothetical protein